jgi:hypothetical protein
MSHATEAALQELRMRYQVAHTAYQACVRAVTEATMGGDVVSPALLQKEARALEALKQARASLLAAMGDGEAQQTRSGST